MENVVKFQRRGKPTKQLIWATQCHKPTMTGDGKHTSHKHVDDLGMVQMALCLPHHIAGNYPPGIKGGTKMQIPNAPWCWNIYQHLHTFTLKITRSCR